MSRSLRVRRDLTERVKLAVKRSGFLSQRSLSEEVGLSLATVSNFLNGKPVDWATFVELCTALSLNCEDVAEFEVEPGVYTGLGSPQTTWRKLKRLRRCSWAMISPAASSSTCAT
ncbi:MAG: helix-turn-helix transcriptional regulator [Cyanobacteria bacterium P01_A01_bin.135]